MAIDRGKLLSKLRSVQRPPSVPRSQMTANDPISDDWVIRYGAADTPILFIDVADVPDEKEAGEPMTIFIEVVNAATGIDSNDGDFCRNDEDVGGFEYELTVDPSWTVSETETYCQTVGRRQRSFDFTAPSTAGTETVEIEAKGASRPDTDEWLAGGSRTITITDDSDGGGGGGGGDDDPEPDGSIDTISITDTEWLSGGELEVTVEVEGTNADGLTTDVTVDVYEGSDLLGSEFFTFAPIGDVETYTGTVGGINDPEGTGDLTVEALYTDANDNEGSDSIDIAPYDDGGGGGGGGDDDPDDSEFDVDEAVSGSCTIQDETITEGETAQVGVTLEGSLPSGFTTSRYIDIDLLVDGEVAGTGEGRVTSTSATGDTFEIEGLTEGEHTVDFELSDGGSTS